MIWPEPPDTDIVAWVEYHLPKALKWAEQEAAATRAARKRNLDRMVETGRCPIGHDIDFSLPFVDLGLPPHCGYCCSAVAHEAQS